jgi:hypothetical protein
MVCNVQEEKNLEENKDNIFKSQDNQLLLFNVTNISTNRKERKNDLMICI